MAFAATVACHRRAGLLPAGSVTPGEPHRGVRRNSPSVERHAATAAPGPAGSATGSADTFTTHANPGSRAKASTPEARQPRQRPVAQRRVHLAARRNAARYSAEHGPRVGRLGLAVAVAPAAPAAAATVAHARRALKPNGGSVPDHGSGTRQPSRPRLVRPERSHVGSGEHLVRQVLDLLAGPAPRPGRGRRRRAARASAAAAARARAAQRGRRRPRRSPSNACPRGRSGSRAGRRRGWTAPTSRGAPTACSAQRSRSITARSAPASQAQRRKSKLNAVCSSSART